MGRVAKRPANFDVSTPPNTMTPSPSSLLPSATLYAFTLVWFWVASSSTKFGYLVVSPSPYPIPRMPENWDLLDVATPNCTPLMALAAPGKAMLSLK